MNWSDERYVRLFTRDTVTWLRWSFETRAIFCLMLRKVDRSGVLETGRAYGNAIVSEVAATFIKAVMQSLDNANR